MKTHMMPDGSMMTGEKHTAASKKIKCPSCPAGMKHSDKVKKCMEMNPGISMPQASAAMAKAAKK